MRSSRQTTAIRALLAIIGLLQAPLCAVACLDTGAVGSTPVAHALESATREVESSAASPAPGAAGMAGSPCHGMTHAAAEPPASAGLPPTDTQDAPRQELACGCQDAPAVLVESADATSLAAAGDGLGGLVVFAQRRLDLPPATPTAARLRLREADLPPPDLLLRKSTLIL